MHTATTLIATQQPARVISRLCKHWAHKLVVEWDEQKGVIHFDSGQCELTVQTDGIVALITAPELDRVVQLKQVVAEHIIRMAKPEEISINW